MTEILILGGNAAGMSAAGRVARLDPRLKLTVIEQGPQVSYSICGSPHYISGEIPVPEPLIRYTPESFYEKYGVGVRTGVRVEAVLPSQRRVVAREVATGSQVSFHYDRLLIATGYRPVRIDVPGSNLANVFTLANLSDAQAIRDTLETSPRDGLLVGGGLVNMELSESFRKRGVRVTLVEKGSHVLSDLDPELSILVEDELQRNEVRLVKECTVRSLLGDDRGRVRSVLLDTSSNPIPAEIVMVDIGIRPAVELAKRAGISIGTSGAIGVSPQMETSAPGVYAAGNCAECLHLISDRAIVSATGTVASKQGRVAGENLAGIRSTFRGVLDTWVVRVFGLCVARTGLSQAQALEAGFRPVSVQVTSPAQAPYLSGATPLVIRLTADGNSRKLLGVQAVGAGADKRIDVGAAVLTSGMTIEDAAQLDLAYAPPYSRVWDPFLIGVNALLRELNHLR